MIGPTNALTVTGTVDPGSVTVGSNLKPVKLVNGVATAVDNDLVSTTGNQTIAGNKTFTTPGGVIVRATSNYNSLFFGSTTMYNSLFARSWDSTDTSKYDNDYVLEVPYSTSTENNFALRVYAPRATKGDTTETQTRLSYVCYVNRTNNSGYAGFGFQKNDGGSGTNYIARYNGTQWYNTADTRTYNSSNTSDVVTIGSLQASTDVVHTVGNETIVGFKTFSEPILGTVYLMRSKNINNVSVKVGLASGTGAYKYGSAFYLVTVRDNMYLVSMSSGPSDTIHDTISVINMTTFTQSNIANLEWKMGYYIDENSNIFVTITGPNANRICNVHFLGGSQGGTGGLIIRPTSNDYVDTANVTQFW